LHHPTFRLSELLPVFTQGFPILHLSFAKLSLQIFVAPLFTWAHATRHMDGSRFPRDSSRPFPPR
jgi:hypothetical protein